MPHPYDHDTIMTTTVDGENQFTGTVPIIEVPTKITINHDEPNGLIGYSVEAELHVDGDMFCVKACGDLQSGIAAFGATVSEAVFNFKRSLQKDTVKNFGQQSE